jgi:hypothetical protein
LSKEIREVISNSDTFDAYYIPREENYFNLKNPYALRDSKVLRLFKKGKIVFSGDYFHQTPQVKGNVGQLKSSIIHSPCNTIFEYIEKTNLYTNNEAKKLYENNIKITWWKIIIYPLRYFYYRYIKLKGYKDKLDGLVLCIIIALYTLLQYLKLWELYHNEKKK